MTGKDHMPEREDIRVGEFEKCTLIDEAEPIAFLEAVKWANEVEAAICVVVNDNQVVGLDA